MKECLKFNRLIAEEKNIKIETKFDKDIPELIFDKTKIKQVLNNLISNAIKFSPNGSAISMRIKRKSDKVITEIIDDGPGIPKNELVKLFKVFQKISVKPINNERGTGLGLAISKKIVEKHEGKIGVQSEIGKGSTFYFSLPF